MTTQWVSTKNNMVITYKDNDKITYPVYVLPSSNWTIADGLVTIDGLIVDDRNMEGESLGRRRLMTPYDNLFSLKKLTNNLVGIIKSGRTNFIDSKGMLFIYEKTRNARLRFRKIERIEKKERACLLYIYRWKIPFIIPRPPPEAARYAGILHICLLYTSPSPRDS